MPHSILSVPFSFLPAGILSGEIFGNATSFAWLHRSFPPPFFSLAISLSHSRRGKIFRLSRLAGSNLFSNAGDPRFARLRHPSAGHSHPDSGISAPLGQASPDRQMDDADLALRFRHRRARLFDAL